MYNDDWKHVVITLLFLVAVVIAVVVFANLPSRKQESSVPDVVKVECFHEGEESAQAGIPPTANPYKPGEIQYEQWMKGWSKSVKEFGVFRDESQFELGRKKK